MAKKLIMAGIDGCHQGILYDLIDNGEARFMKGLCENGTRVLNASTMFPATTVPCCSTLYTGSWFKTHGILNNEWLDRFETPVRARSYIAGMHYALDSMDRRLFGFPSILLPNKNQGGAVNRDLLAPTVYDEFTKAGKTSYAFFHYFGKGATKWIRPSRMDMLRYAVVEEYEKPFQMYERHMVTKAIMNIRRGMPDLLSIYFGCNDGHSHRHGVPAQKEYLRDFVDPEMARLDQAVRSLCPGDEIFWAVTADHGQTNLSEEDIDKCIWYDTFNPVLNTTGYENIQRGLSDSELDPCDAIVSLGDGTTINFYLKSKKSGNWKDQPDYETEMVPLLNNFLKADGGLDPFGGWKHPGYLDFLLARKSFDEPYRVYQNEPPHEGEGRLVELEEFFDGREGYVYPVERIRGLDHPKNSDIIVVLNYRDHYNVNEPEGFHLGQHGSLLPDDSWVPMIFSGPGIKKGEVETALTIDFSPTAASLLGVTMPEADGKILPIT